MSPWSPPSPASADVPADVAPRGAGPWVWQLWIVVPLLVLVAAALSAWLVIRANQAATIEQLSTQQVEETELLARLIGSKLEQSQKVLTTVAEAAAPWALDSKPTLEWLIDQGLPATRYFDSLLFARGAKVLRLNFRADVEGSTEVEPAERDLLRRVMVDGKPQVSEPMKTAMGGPSIAFGMPLRDKNGDVQGAMAGVLRLQSQSLLPVSLAVQSPGSSQLVVMTTGGVVISHPDPMRILGAAADEPALAQALQLWQGRNGPAAKPGALAQWSEPDLISVADIPSARWLAVRVVNRAHMLPVVSQLPATWWIIAAPAALALLALAWLWWHTRRLCALAAAVPAPLAGVSTGVPTDAPPHPRDELGRIAQHMQQLQARQSALAQQLRTQQQLAEGVLEQAPFAFLLLKNERIVEASQALAHLLGYGRQDLLGQSVHMLAVAPGAFDDLWARVAPSLQQHDAADTTVALRHQSGAAVAVAIQLVRVPGVPPGVLWCFVRPGATSANAHAVGRVDPLTQLPNYDALFLHLSAVLQGQRDARLDEVSGAPVLLYVNVDNMSAINALAGRAQGDTVLQHVARQLQLLQLFQGFAARVAGDTFALVLRQCSVEKADELAARFCESLQNWQPELQGRHFVVTASVGLLRLGPQFADAQQAIRTADMACDDAKRHGGNTARWSEAPRARPQAAR